MRRRLSLLLGEIRNRDNGRNPSSRASRVGKIVCGEILELYRGVGLAKKATNHGIDGVGFPPVESCSSTAQGRRRRLLTGGAAGSERERERRGPVVSKSRKRKGGAPARQSWAAGLLGLGRGSGPRAGGERLGFGWSPLFFLFFLFPFAKHFPNEI